MIERQRDYLFYDVAVSICAQCYRRVDAKILFRDDRVVMTKRCPEHGVEEVLIAEDVEYYRRAREFFLKPSEMPQRFSTPVRFGCPYDCGLCTDHEQHSCVSIVEITDHCDLRCPICYAESGPHIGHHRSLEQIERMLDAVVQAEGEPDVVQISGGEPTRHPDFFAVLDAARRRPIRHLMINTNGVRIARDPAFAEQLASYMPGFEVYLQFDSFEREALLDIRGADLRDVRTEALAALDALGVSTTLVVTLKKGVNDNEIGKIVDYAVTLKSVRGVTFQPVQDAGRTDGFNPASDRLTLTGVRRRLLEQSSLFKPEDVLPVPCHPDAIAMAYALKLGDETVPVSGLVDPEVLLAGGRNTIAFERDADLWEKLLASLSVGHSPASGAASLRELLCCLPKVDLPPELGYDNLFRVIIMDFLDAHSFDVRSVKKTCVHIVHPDDGRMIPLDTYNLFYRGDLEATRLGPLRSATGAS